MKQRTIKKSVRCSGIGLHGGDRVQLELHPAPENKGIVFRVQKDRGTEFLETCPENVISTDLATTLGRDGVSVGTVEHLMAAIRGLGLDNLFVDVQGGEVPIMDGSAASFVLLIRSAGVREQAAEKKVLALKREVRFVEEGRWIRATPADSFRVSYSIDFDHPLVGRQQRKFVLKEEGFVRGLSRARTFGFLHQVEALQKKGLARGGSLENAVVLDEYGVVNPEGLRFEDELVRHKILDFIGDMGLLEHQLWGHFEVHCSGHSLNNAFLRHLSANREDYLEPALVSAPASATASARKEKLPEASPAWA